MLKITKIKIEKWMNYELFLKIFIIMDKLWISSTKENFAEVGPFKSHTNEKNDKGNFIGSNHTLVLKTSKEISLFLLLKDLYSVLYLQICVHCHELNQLVETLYKLQFNSKMYKYAIYKKDWPLCEKSFENISSSWWAVSKTFFKHFL